MVHRREKGISLKFPFAPFCRYKYIAYQENPELNERVEQMKAIAERINKAIKEKDIEIKDGKLNINYWDYED